MDDICVRRCRANSHNGPKITTGRGKGNLSSCITLSNGGGENDS